MTISGVSRKFGHYRDAARTKMGALWSTGLFVLFVSSSGHAQTDEWSAIVCNKNNTNNTIALEMKSIGACSPDNATAAKLTALQNNLKANQQIVNNAGSAILGLVTLFGQSDNNVAPAQPDPAARRAAQAAQLALRQQELNAGAADTLAQANSLMASINGGASGSAVAPDATAALNSLLDTQPSNASTAAIGALLGDSAPATAPMDSTTAVAGLLTPAPQGQSAPTLTAQANAPVPGDPLYQPPPMDQSYGAGLTFPMQDPQMIVDRGDSVDQPDPSMFGPMKQVIQSGVGQAEQQIQDGLNKLIAPVQSLIAPIVNDPGVQTVYHVIANGGATMPLTTPTDSGDTMFRNVAGQAWVGNLGGRYSAGKRWSIRVRHSWVGHRPMFRRSAGRSHDLSPAGLQATILRHPGRHSCFCFIGLPLRGTGCDPNSYGVNGVRCDGCPVR
jgi:hypothetical protein